MINKRRTLHRTILGSIFLLGAMLLAACSGTSTGQPSQTSATPGTTPEATATTSSTSVDWKTYTANKQFTINYPSTWSVNAGEPLWSFSTGDSDATTQAVTVVRNNTPVQDPKTMLVLALPILYGSGCKATPVSQTIINGVPYATMTPTDCVETATPNKEVLYVQATGSATNFVFGCRGPASTYSTFEQTYCQPMIASFKTIS
ncbi:MAG TPA: hypothetical protein VGN34_08725 [Ktedonobacteraceae bacterium]|jgi:hypothetical protein